MYKKIFLVVISVFILVSCSNNASNFDSQEKELLSMVSPESELVMGVNFESVKESPLFTKFFEEGMRDRYFDRWMRRSFERASFAPGRDIERIILFSNSIIDLRRDVKGIIKGTFNKEKLIDVIEDEVMIDEFTYEDQTVYFTDFEDVYFAFLNEEIIVFTQSSTSIKGIIDRFLKRDDTFFSNRIMNDLINDVLYKEQMWCVGNASDFMDFITHELRFEFPDFQGIEALSSFGSFMASCLFGEGFKFEFKGIFKEQQYSENYVDMVKGALALGKLRFSDDKEILELINKIKVRGNNNSLIFNIDLTEEQIENLKDYKKRIVL